MKKNNNNKSFKIQIEFYGLQIKIPYLFENMNSLVEYVNNYIENNFGKNCYISKIFRDIQQDPFIVYNSTPNSNKNYTKQLSTIRENTKLVIKIFCKKEPTNLVKTILDRHDGIEEIGEKKMKAVATPAGNFIPEFKEHWIRYSNEEKK